MGDAVSWNVRKEAKIQQQKMSRVRFRCHVIIVLCHLSLVRLWGRGVGFWTSFCIFDHFPEEMLFIPWHHLFRLIEMIILKKITVQKEPSVQILYENVLFIFGRKIVVWCFVWFAMLQYFVQFWLIFVRIEAVIKLRKMLFRKQLLKIKFVPMTTVT